MAVNPDSIPRYPQPMDPVGPRRTCGGCDHYTDLVVVFCSPHNGLAGVCCLGRDELGTDGELVNVDDRDEACDRWKEGA